MTAQESGYVARIFLVFFHKFHHLRIGVHEEASPSKAQGPFRGVLPQGYKHRKVIKGDKGNLFEEAIRQGLLGEGDQVSAKEGAVDGIRLLGHDGGDEGR